MPIYFFHIRGRDEFIRDLEGMELPDMAAVREEASEGARTIMADRVRKGSDPDHQAFQVEDDAGRTVLDYPFLDALKPKGD